MIFAHGYDTGCVRDNNEDYFYVPTIDSYFQNLAIVADGMGGHNAGEIASRVAVEKVIEYLSSVSQDIIDVNFVRSSIRIANNAILKMSKKEEYKNMGTTLTVAYFKKNSVVIGHVGDSRAYIISDGEIKQLTKDHTYVQMLIDKGDITKEEAQTHEDKNVLIRAVGVDRSIQIDTFEYPVKENDIIFLCSDGLTNYVSDEEIKEHMMGENRNNAVQALVDLAKERGGADNITVVIGCYADIVLQGRYKLTKHIGSGGMADVYCASDLANDNKYVSIKMLKKELLSDEDAVKRFKQEASVLLKMKYKNIPRTYSLVEEPDKMYLVLDYIDGYNLKDYVEKFGPINEETAINIGLQIARSLRYVHNSGYIHKDVKPQNILITKDLDAYLIDFGLATKGNKSSNDDIVLGSVYYFSPEQAKGEEVSQRSDIYSLGIVLYEMITGELPFKGNAIHKVIRAHLNAKAVPPHDLNNSISLAISQVIMKAISKNEELRYVNFNSFITDLKRAQKHPAGDFVTLQKVPISDTEGSLGLKNVLISCGIIVGVFAILIGASYIIASKDNSFNQSIIMPNLEKMYLDEATAKLDSIGLSYQIEYYENDNVGNGTIIHQSIKQNKETYVGNKVILGVAINSKSAVMPNFYSSNKDDAVSFLENANIKNIEFVYVDSTLPFNFVVEQQPKANEELTNVTDVVLYISNNHITNTVPMVTGLSLEKAIDKSIKEGFSIGIIYEEKNRENEVYSQLPVANQKFTNDTTIDLWTGFDEDKKVLFEHTFGYTVKEDRTKVVVCYEEDNGFIYYVDEFILNKGVTQVSVNFYSYTEKPKNLHIYVNNTRQQVIENIGVN